MRYLTWALREFIYVYRPSRNPPPRYSVEGDSISMTICPGHRLWRRCVGITQPLLILHRKIQALLCVGTALQEGRIRNVIANVAIAAQIQLTCMSSEWKHNMLEVCEGSMYSMKAGLETKGQVMRHDC
jgi:hypothetical protein